MERIVVIPRCGLGWVGKGDFETPVLALRQTLLNRQPAGDKCWSRRFILSPLFSVSPRRVRTFVALVPG